MKTDKSIMNTTVISLANLAGKIIMTKIIVDGFVRLYGSPTKKDELIDVDSANL